MAHLKGGRGSAARSESVIPRQPIPQEPMVLSDRELWLVRSALQAYLTCLSHTEGDLEHEVKELIKKLQQWKCPGCAWSEITLPEAKKLTL